MKWKLIAALIIAMLLSLYTVSAQSAQDEIIPIALWTNSDKEYAWFIDDEHVLLGEVMDNNAPRADVTYNPKTGYVVYGTYVEIRDAKTGSVLWSDTPPAGYFRVAKPSADGTSLIKVVDIPFKFAVNLTNYKRLSAWAVPYGIVSANDTHVVIFDYNGNVIKSFDWVKLKDYGYNLSGIVADLPAMDSMFVTPDGSEIVWQGAWIESVGDNDIIIFDKDLNPIQIIPDEVSNAEAVSINENYIITASNQAGNQIIIIDRNTLDYAVYNGTPVVETNEPVYMSTLTTVDGKYIFAIKETDDANDKGVLEVWEWLGGTSIQLVESYNLTILDFETRGVDTLQPMSFSESSFSEVFPWGAMTNVLIYYNRTTGEYRVFILDNTIKNRLATISPQARYAILGDTMYMLAHQDIHAKEPRVRFQGKAIFNYGEKPVDLSKPVVLEAPDKEQYKVYFDSGKVKITSLVGEERPVSLITDPDVQYGKLGRMLEKGLIGYDVIYQDGAEVRDHSLEKIDDRTISYYRVHVMKNLIYSKLFGGQESVADSGIVIRVPLQGTVSTYSELIQKQSIAVVTVAPVFDWKNELLGAFGLEFLAGATSEGVSKALLSDTLKDIAKRRAYDELALGQLADKLHPNALKAGRILGRAVGVVGIALMVDSAVTAYTHYIDYTNVKTTMFVAPVVEDVTTGNKYAVVAFVLPESEISQRADEYSSYVKTYLKNKLGVADVGVTFIAWGADWDEYNARLEAGRLPDINLEELVITQIASAYGISTSKLKYKEVAIVIDTITRGYASLWDFIGGGTEIPVETRASGQGIEIKGVIPSFITTDPQEIATLIPVVQINGMNYTLNIGADGAIANFLLPVGTKYLVVRFPNSPYLATMRIDTNTIVESPFINESYGIMRSEFHYDWNNTLIVLDRIELVDMPYQMKYVERTFRYKYGEFTHDVTQAFELNQSIDDPTSPTGKRYYYVTQQNTKFIDPANGGTMQPCKTYIFRYFYVNKTDLGNAWVNVYFNGTTVTSTIPRHASLYIGSNNVAQTVSGTITVATKYRDETKKIVTVMEETYSWSKSIPANGSILIEYDIEKFVAKAQELLTQGKVGFVEVTAKITDAQVNEITTDDESRIVYYPPPTLPQTGTPVTLSIRVLDYLNHTAISGATVTIDGTDVLTTDANGWANTSIVTGLHTINVSATGYYNYSDDLNVYENMTHTIYLIPEGATILPPDGNETDYPAIDFNGTIYYPLAVLVQYEDGMPYDGATVTVLNNTTQATIFTGVTDGSGYAYFPIEANSTVDVQVTAGNFTANQTNITMDSSKLIAFTVNQTSSYFTPEVALSDVQIVIHRGQGWYYGNVSHFILTSIWTNTPQTVDLYLRLYDTQNNTISEKTITGISLQEGVNVVMDWLDVNVSSEFKNVTIYAKIVNYQQDTNTSNNELVGNTVTLKPFLDMYATVIWKPVKQKISYAILPEDVIEVSIGFVIPAKITDVDIKATINEFDLKEKIPKAMEGKSEKVATFAPTTIWRNFTVVVPYTNKLVIEANISHPLEDFIHNNNMTLEIPVDPDTKVEEATPSVLVVSSGSPTPVTVKISSNALGRVYVVAVQDMTTKNLIGKKDVEITEPNMTVTIEATAPNINGFSETHIWNASVNGIDFYDLNNYNEFQVTIWGIPWWAILVGILLIVLFLLATLRAIIATAKNRATPEFRYFRKLDGEETSSKHMMSSEGKGLGKFRFFRKL